MCAAPATEPQISRLWVISVRVRVADGWGWAERSMKLLRMQIREMEVSGEGEGGLRWVEEREIRVRVLESDVIGVIDLEGGKGM